MDIIVYEKSKIFSQMNIKECIDPMIGIIIDGFEFADGISFDTIISYESMSRSNSDRNSRRCGRYDGSFIKGFFVISVR